MHSRGKDASFAYVEANGSRCPNAKGKKWKYLNGGKFQEGDLRVKCTNAAEIEENKVLR